MELGGVGTSYAGGGAGGSAVSNENGEHRAGSGGSDGLPGVSRVNFLAGFLSEFGRRAINSVCRTLSRKRYLFFRWPML